MKQGQLILLFAVVSLLSACAGPCGSDSGFDAQSCAEMEAVREPRVRALLQWGSDDVRAYSGSICWTLDHWPARTPDLSERECGVVEVDLASPAGIDLPCRSGYLSFWAMRRGRPPLLLGSSIWTPFDLHDPQYLVMPSRIGRIALRVLDPQGKPIEAARAQLVVGRRAGPARWEGCSAKANEDGELVLEQVVDDNAWVDVFAPGYARVRTQPSVVEIGATVRPATIVLPTADEWSVSVRTEAGRPMEGVRVGISYGWKSIGVGFQRWTEVTDGHGEFLIDLPLGADVSVSLLEPDVELSSVTWLSERRECLVIAAGE